MSLRLDAVIRWFMPREERFHELLAEDTANLVAAARVFAQIAKIENLEERRVKMTELRSLEHKGDQITRRVFEALNSTFITPLDREDIRSIATDLDDILDFLEAAAQHLILFELDESPEALRQFTDILVAMVEEIDRITTLFWDMGKAREVQAAMVKVSDLENRADALYNTVIADLFKGDGRDPVWILKWKEVYEGLENACDECKDYTHIIGNIVIKNA